MAVEGFLKQQKSVIERQELTLASFYSLIVFLFSTAYDAKIAVVSLVPCILVLWLVLYEFY